MPAVPPYIIEPIWEQFALLLPERAVDQPLGCHRPRVPDRVVFKKLVVQVLVLFGCAYWRISYEKCSVSTLRRRRGTSLSSASSAVATVECRSWRVMLLRVVKRSQDEAFARCY